MNFGRTLASDVRAVFVTDDLEDARRAARSAGSASCPASRSSSSSRRTARSSARSIAYLDVLDQAWPPDKEAPITIVVLPEYVARHWWERMLYNQSAQAAEGGARRP